MKHLSTTDFLRDLARRVDQDYDRGRLESIADVVDSMDSASRARLEPVDEPLPGSTSQSGGATITHRPDVAYAEGALRKADAAGHGGLQAVGQGEPGFLPVKRVMSGQDALAAGVTHAGGTIQQLTPAKPAEAAAIGMTTR